MHTEEPQRIIRLLKKEFLLDNGTLTMAKIGDKKYPYHIFPDLGDYLPFFLYFKEYEFIDKQINIFKGLLVNEILISEHATIGFRGLAKSYEYSDLIYGLIDFYNHKKDLNSRNLLIDNVNIAIKIFNLDGNFNSYYHPVYKIHFPIKDSRDGMMIELFIELYNTFGDNKYLFIAKNIYSRMITGRFYSRYKLFPIFSSNVILELIFKKKLRKFFNCSKIMKGNTNTLFGFLELYKQLKDDEIIKNIDQIILSIKNKATIDGGIVDIFCPNYKSNVSNLTPSFALLDFLCDLYYLLKRGNDLKFAITIADFWISKQGETGLFPLLSNGKESCLDSETDMTIALYKLFELTKDIKYKLAADRCFDGIIKYHSKNNYVLGLDIDTGEIIDKKQRTKYLTLFLKLLILKNEYNNGEKIYENKKLFNLLKDR